jgi:thiamine biosynthesis lipoprotein ApbE
MRCNPSARWGPGTTKEREIDTHVSKELKEKMEAMMKEREKQNNMWSQSSQLEEKSSAPVFSTSTPSSTQGSTSR